jgi:hypothetical protein
MFCCGKDRSGNFCERLGIDMEDVGPRWILDRLAQEERKLAK